MIPHMASHDGAGVPLEVTLEALPSWTTRMVAIMMQTQPKQNRPPILNFCFLCILKCQIRRIGNAMTDQDVNSREPCYRNRNGYVLARSVTMSTAYAK